MRISRVYFEGQLQTGAVVALPGESSHYLAKVLRLRIDDCVHLFNEDDGEFLARITRIKKSAMELVVEKAIGEKAIGEKSNIGNPEVEKQPLEGETTQAELKIHLGLGLSRGDRMDFAIQKSTELGVRQITPLYTEHGEVKLKADRVEKKLLHWRKIAISASEQCGRLHIPKINAPCLLSDWQQNTDGQFNLMLDPSGQDKLPSKASAVVKQLNLLIGPEGGFSAREITAAQKQGFAVIALGRRILRTETAPIAALAILQHLYGDM